MLQARKANALPSVANVGKERVHRDAVERAIDWEDRCAKLQEENRQLKLNRNEQEQLIKDLHTKFKKLMRDYKALTGVTPNLDTASNASTTPRRSSPKANAVLLEKLATVESQRDTAQRELATLKRLLKMRSATSLVSEEHIPLHRQESIHSYLARHEREAIKVGESAARKRDVTPPRVVPSESSKRQSPERMTLAERHPLPSGSSGETPNKAVEEDHRRLRSRIQELQTQTELDRSTIRRLREDVAAHQAAAAQLSSVAAGHSEQYVDHAREVRALKDRISADAAHMETLRREKEALELKLRLQPAPEDHAGYRTSDADPNTLLQLQRDIGDKTSQMTVLLSRFNHSQEHVALLKRECDRLVEELRASQHHSVETKRRMFDLEQEKNVLLLKADRVDELEVAQRLKADEVIRCEEKLISLVDRLQTCARETETQVRRQCGERIAELESMRDEADRLRRAKERDIFTLQQDLADLKRGSDSMKEEVLHFKTEVERLRKENQDLQQKLAIFGTASADVADDVHKAMTLMTLKRKHKGEVDVAELWRDVEWNDGWEASQMRDAVATAAFDLQLADQRHEQLVSEAKEKSRLLEAMAVERDQLLDDNIDLRRRLTGIQTTLSKRMLAAARGQEVGQRASASLSLSLYRIALRAKITQLPDGTVYTPTLFFTLCGLEGYEMAIGETFCASEGELATTFVFGGLPAQRQTIELIARSTLTLQLHQSFGTECDVVAAATLHGGNIIADFSGSGVGSLNIELVAGDGSIVGEVVGSATLSDHFLPLLLDNAARSHPLSLSPSAVKAALVALRGITGLRIQIFRAANLCATPAIPQPYVFYTVIPSDGQSVEGCFVRDTVTHPAGQRVTAAPEFDANDAVVHPVVLDVRSVQFVHSGVITFVLFDAASANLETNLGVATVPLRSLLRSPTETLVSKERLHPQGEIEVGFSWVHS